MITKESDLSDPTINFLQDAGFKTYCEVPIERRIIDIVAVNKDIVMSIELKLSFSIDLLFQAIMNKEYTDFSYVLVPFEGKSFDFKYSKKIYKIKVICYECDIGILSYKNGVVKALYKPNLNIDNRKHKLIKNLREYQKNRIAGIKGKRITDFKMKYYDMYRVLFNDPCSSKDLYRKLTPYTRKYNTINEVKNTLSRYDIFQYEKSVRSWYINENESTPERIDSEHYYL